MSIRQALEQANVSTRTLNKVNEFAINCPWCGDSKYRCYVNPVKLHKGITGWYYCHRRGCSGPISRLLSYFGIKGCKTEVTEYEPTTFESLKAKLMNLENCDYNENIVPVKPQGRGFDFDQFKIPYRNSSNAAKRARAYLARRGFSDEQIEDYKLRYSDEGDYSGRIIIPFFEYNELVYFQARGYTISTVNKIQNPPLNAFIGGKSDYLFNFDQAKLHRIVIICEGWASAMTAGYNSVAIGGNRASEVQLQKLTGVWNNFVVMLDNGMESQSFRLAKELLFLEPSASVKVILLPYGDPNNFEPRHLIHLVNKAKVYKSVNEIEMDMIRTLTERNK